MRCLCDFENAPDARFCGSCGSALSDAPSRPGAVVTSYLWKGKERRIATVLSVVAGVAIVAGSAGYWWRVHSAKTNAVLVAPPPVPEAKAPSPRNFTEIDQFFVAFKRAIASRNMNEVAELVEFPFEELGPMSKEDFVAHLRMTDDQIKAIQEIDAPTRYEGDLGYGVNLPTCALTFRKDRDGYWRWVSIYYGE